VNRSAELVLATVLVAALVGLCVMVGWPYAMTRIVHIDEFNNLYSARLLDAYRSFNASDTVELYLLAVSRLTRDAGTTFEMLAILRVCFFWLLVGGLCIVPLGLPGLKPLERATLLVLAFLCVPLWRHGIEVRHDQFLGFGLAALYVLTERARQSQLPLFGYAAAGAIAVFMQFNAHKGFALGIPSLGFLLFVTDRRGGNTRCALAGIVGGASLMFALVFSLYAADGLLSRYLQKILAFSDAALAAGRFSPMPSLRYFLLSAPIQTGLAIFALVVAVRRAKNRQLDAVTLGAAFFLLSLAAFIANPNPFPYNMSWLGFGVLIGASQGLLLFAEWAAKQNLSAALAVVVLTAGAAILTWSRDAFLTTPLDGQRAIISAAEELTTPDQPILDGGGLVATRPPASKHWLIHSLVLRDYLDGKRDSVITIADKAAPPVLIRYYRWNWLPANQIAEFEKTYVPVSDQLWVLGCRSNGDFTCRLRRAGRYVLKSEHPTSIDGVSQNDGAVIELAAGEHPLSSEGAVQLAWLGPHAMKLPEVAPFAPMFRGNEL
jgi:hypothetical protein